MATQKKHNTKHTTSSAASTPAGEVKVQLKRFNWLRALIIGASTVAAYVVYQLLLNVPALQIGGIPIIMPVYIGAATLLVALVVIFNSGLSTKPITVDMLRADEGDSKEDLQMIADKLNARKKTAKKLMLLLIPFVFTLFFDMIILFYGDFFIGAFKALSGGDRKSVV